MFGAASRRSDYLDWTRRRQGIRYSLSRSSAPRFDMRELASSLDQVLINEPNDDGWLPLREAIARRTGLTPGHVALANACTGANNVVYGLLLERGDHVAVETPVYEPLVALAHYFGAQVDFFARREENEWRVDPDDVRRVLTPRTKLVVLSNLHNPTGCHDGGETLSRVATDAARIGAHLLVDEVYLELFPGRDARTAAPLAPNILVTSSMTKAYGLDLLRMGWVLAEPALAERARRLTDLYTNNFAHPSERLAHLALLRADEILARVNAVLNANMALVDAFVAAQPGLSWIKPRAGTCGMVRVEGMNVDELEQTLARDYATGIVPGRFFNAPNHFRLAWGVDTDTLRAGLDCFSSALARV